MIHNDAIKSADDLRDYFSVSRETVEALEIYGKKIVVWQRALNLVASKTLPDKWHRHFADSLQLLDCAPAEFSSFADFGSGGGFPGLVLAIALRDLHPRAKLHLVESDQRKSAFLRDVARTLKLQVNIQSTRIEADATGNAIGLVDLISARALAPLDRLFQLIHPFCHASTVAVLPKGKSVDDEIALARQRWTFDLELRRSRTDPDGRIAIVRDLRPGV
ncbi:MAG: 16S rRNA (guanine(527)-N(7))-methyltransferase RsmG [Pseudomonadota bacterium]